MSTTKNDKIRCSPNKKQLYCTYVPLSHEIQCRSKSLHPKSLHPKSLNPKSVNPKSVNPKSVNPNLYIPNL